jgi:hypothetical protein
MEVDNLLELYLNAKKDKKEAISHYDTHSLKQIIRQKRLKDLGI